MRTRRPAARVAVLDPDGAIFLLRYDDEEVGLHWAMPGGGIEGTETPREGAQRELREETGWTDLELGPLLCTWEHDFTRAGVPVRQHEHAYLTNSTRREPTPDVAAMHVEDGILGWRWWNPTELATTSAPLWPPQLPVVLGRLRCSDAAKLPPVELGYVANT